MPVTKAIIFGPSGNVGSVTALTAQQLGLKVFLAMRDTQKTIPSLEGFERVYADLTKPDTIQDAVQKTGARHAFVYLVKTPDNMRSTIAALKSAGIEFVVFLSSDSVRGDIRSITIDNFIPWTHAQAESHLEDIFGGKFVAVRPSWFATNTLWLKKMIRQGHVKMAYPNAKFDWITPGDMGRVCGKLLLGTGAERLIRLSGPQLISQQDAVGIIGKVTGKEIKVEQLDEQGGVEALKSVGLPDPVAKELVHVMSLCAEEKWYDQGYEEAVNNIGKYAGKHTTFLDWVISNKEQFEGSE